MSQPGESRASRALARQARFTSNDPLPNEASEASQAPQRNGVERVPIRSARGESGDREIKEM